MTRDDATTPGETPCEKAITTLWMYLDGETDPQDTERVEEHLRACAECVDCREAEVKLRATLRRACEERAPDSLRVAIARLRMEQVLGDGCDKS